MDEEVKRLIWSDYDEHQRGDPVPGQEKYNPDKFRREYQVFRLTHLPGKIVSLSNRTQLPNGSMLHLLDDWMFDDHSDTIRPDAHFFIRAESLPTYIYHIKEPQPKGALTWESNYIYNQAKLPTNLMAFRSLYGSRFKYANSKDEIPQKPTIFAVINHNPINRLRVLGKMRGFNRFQTILTSILNTMCDFSDLRKQQWLYIPWGEEVYDKMSFLKSREALTATSIVYPDSFQWLMQMHLYNFMLKDATTSIFDQIPEKILPQINLILNLNDKYLFYNLKDLKDMSNQNGAFLKFTNQIDLLSTIGRISKDGSDDGIPEEAVGTIETIHGIGPKPITMYSNTKPVDGATDEVTLNEGTPDEKVVSKASLKHIVQYDLKHPEIDAMRKGRASPPIVQQVVATVIKRLDQLIPKSKVCILGATSVGYQIPNPHQYEEPKTNMAGKVYITETIEPVLNSTKINLEQDLKTDELISKEYYQDLQDSTKEYIENREELTPKQKERYHRLSKKWEECKLGGVPLKTLLLDRNDIGLDHEAIPESLVGELPDKSALKSSISALDRDYMDKTFPKHIASILVSFSKNGVFLVDLKEEKIVNELQNVTQYSATYEDIRGKRSTVKFAIPNVDRDGKVKIDGVTQVLKKQKINLPIVKISDTVVSLASNQNKTRVERNCTKAHSYFSYIDGLINGPKSNAKITYGKSQVNLPISYEYAAIGERFKQVQFKHGSDNWDLYFDYHSRDSHFNGKPLELIALEAQYGTYFGRTNNDWVFIDNQNTVTAVRQKGGENVEMGEYKSIAQILLLSLKPGEKYDKTLTEWCNVKILDAFLPVIFLLGYRYGLRKILDYLKIKYTITEKRSKVIVGESIPGQESYPIIATESYDVYHISHNKDSLKKYGLCSPRALYKADKQLFHEHTYHVYEGRAKSYLKKTQVTDEDIIRYLDEGRPPCTADCIFFAFNSSDEMPHVNYGSIELAADIDMLKKYRMGNPLITPNGKYNDHKGEWKEVTWDELKANLNKLKDEARKEAKQPVGPKTRLYAHIVHLAIPLKPIPFKEFKVIRDNPIQSQEDYSQMFGAHVHTVAPTGENPFEGTDWIKIAGQEAAYAGNLSPIHDLTEKFYDSVQDTAVWPILHLLWNMGIDKITFYKQRKMHGRVDRIRQLAVILAQVVNMEPRITSPEEMEKFCIDYMKSKARPDEVIMTRSLLEEQLKTVLRHNSRKDIEKYIAQHFTAAGQCLAGNPLIALKNTLFPVVKELFPEQAAYWEKYQFGKIHYWPFNWVTSFYKRGIKSISRQALEMYCDEVMAHERCHFRQPVKQWEHDLMHPIIGRDYQYNDMEYEAYGVSVTTCEKYAKDHGANLLIGMASWQMLADVPPTETKSNVDISTIPMSDASKTILKIPKAPKLSTSKIKGLDILKKLQIPNTDLLVFASASMILWGIKKDSNRDLDVKASDKYMKKLMKDGSLTTQMDNGLPHVILKDAPMEVDFGIVDPKYNLDFNMLMGWGTCVVDGIRFQNIFGLFRLYFHLLTHAPTKELHAKRVKQITELSKAVSDWFDHKCYHGSPETGLKEIRAHVAPTYKKMGPLVFASYYKLFAMVFGYWWKDDVIECQTTTLEDGISIGITLTIKKTLNEAELSVPFSVYTLSDKDFDHLMVSTEDPLAQSHPIKEIIHKGNVKVLKEERYPSWWDAMLALEKAGYLTIKNKNRVQKPKLLKGVGPTDAAIQEATEEGEEVPSLPISADIRYAPMYGDIPIKFADRILWINRYPLAHSLIVAGLDQFDLTAYDMAQFDSKDVYYKLLQDKGMSINYLKGIDSFFDLFIDPITYNNLKMMNEPTDMRDLLIRSVVLLTTLDARPPSSSKNFRVRGYEQFAAVLYNEMARHYAAYANQRGSAAQFSLPPDAVYLRILQNASMLQAEASNPLENMKEATYLTHVGIGGRAAESFVHKDRRVTRDDTGIMSESTVDNGKVGINAYLTYDPGIANTMGVLDPKKIDEQDPGNAFSVFSLTFPYATQDVDVVPSHSNVCRITPLIAGKLNTYMCMPIRSEASYIGRVLRD